LNLLQIPLHFNYEVYTTTRRERDLDTYLNALSDIVQRHTTADVCRRNVFIVLYCFCCCIRFLMLFQNVLNVFVMLVLHYQIELLHIVEILLIKF
jgi:hypothetical protein